MTETLKKVNCFVQEHAGIFTLLFVVLPITLFVAGLYMGQHKKELTVSIEEEMDIISINLKDEKLKVLYDNKPVNDPMFISIHFKNTGSETINYSDFIEPLTVLFDNEIEVLTANLNSKNELIAKDLANNAKFKGNSIVLSKFMLNGGESFVVNVILSKTNKRVKYSYRLTGITSINEANPTNKKFMPPFL